MNNNSLPETQDDIRASHQGSLITLLEEAHYLAGKRNPSISRDTFLSALAGSGNITQAIAAALLTTGKMHAPLNETRQLFNLFRRNPEMARQAVREALSDGMKIPGVGNSFFKDSIDPSFRDIKEAYEEVYALIYPKSPISILDGFTEMVNSEIAAKKEPESFLYANAAGITAAVMELFLAPPYFENWVFISGRTRAWIELAINPPES